MKAYRRKPSSRPPLTVGLITKNEEKNIENCLKALLALKEAIGAQILVGDTGSTDRTIEIAERYADEVFHVEWTNDFAAARNAVMDRGTGEWYLSVDADEWLDDPKELIEFFQSGRYRDFASASVTINNISYAPGEKNNEKDNPFSTIRMCQLIKENRFEGKIHESLTCVIPYEDLHNTVFTHYGYFYKGPAGEKKHKERTKRNHDLLIQELERDPLDLRINCLTLDSSLSPVESLSLANRVKTILQENPKAWEEHKKHPFGVSYIGSLIDKATDVWYANNDFDSILEMGEKMRESYSQSLFLPAILRKILFARAAKREVSELMPLLKSYFEALEYNRTHEKGHPEKMFGIVTGTSTSDIFTCIFQVCDSFNNIVKAQDSIDESVSEAITPQDVCFALSKIDIEALSPAHFSTLLGLLLRTYENTCDVMPFLQQCQSFEYIAEKKAVLDEFWSAQFSNENTAQQAAIEKLQTANCYSLLLLQLFLRAKTSNSAQLEEDFLRLCRAIQTAKIDNPTFYMHSVAMVCFRLGISLPENIIVYVNETLYGAACVCVQNSKHAFSSVFSYLESTDSNKTVPQLYWEVFLLYNLFQKNLLQNHVLVDENEDLPTADELSHLFERFIYLSDMLLQSIFSSALLNSEDDAVCALPQFSRFCRFMVRAAEELERGNFVQSLRLAKKALQQDVRMKNLVKWFCGRSEFSSLSVAPSEPKIAANVPPAVPAKAAVQNPEFAALAAQFRPKIEALINDGHTQECLPMLRQYLTLCPDDEEMAALLRKLTQPEPAPAQSLSQNPEFAALAAQFRPKIEALINDGHTQECLPMLRQYLTLCPDDKEMAALLRKLTQPEPAPAQPLSQNPEFAALAAQFRPKIEALINSGHTEQCLPLLKQYLTLCPDDEEMKKLLDSLEQA